MDATSLKVLLLARGGEVRVERSCERGLANPNERGGRKHVLEECCFAWKATLRRGVGSHGAPPWSHLLVRHGLGKQLL
jgi:hypothetical protein